MCFYVEQIMWAKKEYQSTRIYMETKRNHLHIEK